MPIILFYLISVNVVSFVLFGVDKRRAIKHDWRIKEKTLLISCFLGGGLGGLLGMFIFRHKTKHLKFLTLVPLSILLWIILLIFFANKIF